MICPICLKDDLKEKLTKPDPDYYLFDVIEMVCHNPECQFSYLPTEEENKIDQYLKTKSPNLGLIHPNLGN